MFVFFVVVTRLYNTVLCNITDMSAKVTVFFFIVVSFVERQLLAAQTNVQKINHALTVC